MTFPKEQKSKVAKIGGAVKEFFGFNNHDQVQEECLQIFLEKHKDILTNVKFCTIPKLKFSFVNNVYHIYEQLLSHSLCRGDVLIDSKCSANQLPKVCIKNCIDTKHY